jgi:hypothetical protein
MEQQQELPIGRKEAAGEGPLQLPPGVTRAAEMLEAFRSVGVERFRLTCTDISEQKRVYRQYEPSILLEKLPVIFETARERQWNIIVRPTAVKGVTLIQLDDLDREALRCVEGLGRVDIHLSHKLIAAMLRKDMKQRAVLS